MLVPEQQILVEVTKHFFECMLVSSRGDIHQCARITRQANHLRRIRALTTLGQKSLQFLGPAKYNQLPDYIKLIENRTIFNAKLKQFYKQKLNELFR